MVDLFAMEYMTALGITMVLLFLDSRYSRKRTILVVCGAAVLVMALIAVLYRTFGAEITLHSYSLVVHIPSLLLFCALSRCRGWQVVFQLLSAILFCALVQHGAALACYLSGNRIWVLILAYAVLSGGLIWFLLRFLRPLFLQTLLELRQGWWFICLVMAVYYVIIIYMIPGFVGSVRSSTVLKPAISLLMAGFYSVVIFLFTSIRKESEARHSAQMTALQLSALQSRMEAVRAAENAIRMERHDLRHRLLAVTELVARGDRDAAMEFLNTAQRRLDEQKEAHWCRPPVLDAVFSSYFEQARQEGIQVEAQIALPDKLPVDEGELAVVLANALENAVHANLELPPERRWIHCRAVGTPSVMLELTNPCAAPVDFDAQGLPMARKEGHGLGVRSISVFCKKHGAVFHFDWTDGTFLLRLIL